MEINDEFNTALELVYKAANEETKKALETNFPQLRESDDERIRKEIIRIVDIWTDSSPVVNGIPRETLLAYLEKQKEQKLSTPKYRVGEVMRTKQEAAEGITDGLPVIVSMDDNYYYCTNEKIPISEQDEYEFPPMNMRQQPGKWSEEDENRFRNLIYLVEHSNEGKGTKEGFVKFINRLKSLLSQSRTNHTVWHNASEEKPTKLPIIHIWYHGNRVNTVVAHENIGLQEELDDINFQPDDKWAYVEDLLNVQPHWKPSEEQMTALKLAYEEAFECPEACVPHLPLKSLLADLKNYFNL